MNTTDQKNNTFPNAGTGSWPPGSSADSCRLDTISPSSPTPTTDATSGSAQQFSLENIEKIRAAVQKKYQNVSLSTLGLFQYPTGEQGAVALGYDPAVIAATPPAMLRAFYGVGNPFAPGFIGPGDYVLDIGCGAGFDMLNAGRLTGRDGLVCGTDLTPEMAEVAETGLMEACENKFEIIIVDSEILPFSENFFDRVISNGVINLMPDKQKIFTEIFRVLKPGGLLRFADVILEKARPAPTPGDLEAWAQ